MTALIRTLRHLRHGPLKRFAPFWRLAGSAYRWLQGRIGSRSTVASRIGPYGPFRLNGRFAFSNFEQWGERHNAGFQVCVEACRGRHCVLDVGAHIGLVAMPVASVLAPEGRVYAFEPAAANRQFLLGHLAANQITQVEVIPDLVGDCEKTGVRFHEMDGDAGMNSVVIKKDLDAYQVTEKNQVTIDGFCRQRRIHPEVIKIDVEGYELFVLQGAKETLTTKRPLVFLSIHPGQIALLGQTTDAIVELLHALNYDILDPVDRSPVTHLEMNEYLLLPREENRP
ncbi:MAG: FkbM family methyltransferase [Magnetococcus sp. DMHC-1]|nr:FkbM family methyltransferase [Magnetococcales bacterium]